MVDKGRGLNTKVLVANFVTNTPNGAETDKTQTLRIYFKKDYNV